MTQENKLLQKESEINVIKDELLTFKKKYENLLEQFRLAKQMRFGSSSEISSLQTSLVSLPYNSYSHK